MCYIVEDKYDNHIKLFIMLNEIKIRRSSLDQYDADVLGSYVGYLPQPVTLLAGSIRDNIARMSPTPDDAAVIKAAKQADAHEMILKLPGGYDARVTAAGGRLSGGQMQRIGLARAMYGDPVLLVLDEPTASLDVSVQAQIIGLLEDLRSELGLTYLLISHNLAVVEHLADRVAVMYLGRIVEQGRVEDVLSAPKHPYTQALLSAVPSIRDTGREKQRLVGELPSPINPPQGCHFNPRCPQVMENCRSLYPATTQLAEHHTVRCYLYQQ